MSKKKWPALLAALLVERANEQRNSEKNVSDVWAETASPLFPTLAKQNRQQRRVRKVDKDFSFALL